jgi:hypothetical protein
MTPKISFCLIFLISVFSISCNNEKDIAKHGKAFLNDLKSKNLSNEEVLKKHFLYSQVILESDTLKIAFLKDLNSLKEEVRKNDVEIETDSSNICRLRFFQKGNLMETKYLLFESDKIKSMHPILKEDKVIMWYYPK